MRNVVNFETVKEAKNTGNAPRKNFRRRSPTMLKLQWLAERLRKIDRIKEQLAAGTYSANSSDVAKSVLGICNDEEQNIKIDHLLS